MTHCASELALEAHLFDPAHSEVRPHLESCGACRARLARMEREGEEFRRFVHPRTVDRLLSARERARRNWARVLATLVPAAGIAAAAMLLGTPTPPADYLGAKGTALSMQVWAGSDDGAREISDGGTVPADARLRFRVAAGQPCLLWLVSVDARGEVSRLFPAQGDAPASVKGGMTLPGGVALDGLAGPERLYAICSPAAVPLAEVERSVRGAISGGADALRRGQSLPGLPAGTAQTTLLVEKVP
jgi:anti-sigma factor RsiW